jgi:predicted nucleic acid-binding protein
VDIERVKQYIADTVALAKYLTDDLPPFASKVFSEAEAGSAQILVPGIALGEFIFLCLKGRLMVDDPIAVIKELLSMLHQSDYLVLTDLSLSEWDFFLKAPSLELHDRTIVTMSLSRGLPIITSDAEMKSITSCLWQ